MNTTEVVERFVERRKHRRTKLVTWANGKRSVYSDASDDSLLWSYGRHFPLAKYFGETDYGVAFVRNSDSFSSTTSSHQSIVSSSCEAPQISASALDSIRATGLSFGTISARDIVAAVPAGYHRSAGWWNPGAILLRSPGTGPVKIRHAEGPVVAPRGSMANAIGSRLVGKKLKPSLKDVRLFLSGDSGGRGFVSELRAPAKSIWEAKQSLVPKLVRDAEANGVEVKKIGKWFFVPTGVSGYSDLRDLLPTEIFPVAPSLESMRKLVRAGVLVSKSPDNDSTQFVVSHVGFFGQTLARGVVKAGSSYYQLRLGDEWHRVYQEVETARWWETKYAHSGTRSW